MDNEKAKKLSEVNFARVTDYIVNPMNEKIYIADGKGMIAALAPDACDNSPMVAFPAFTVLNKMSVVSAADNPSCSKAFNADVVMSVAS